MPTVDQQRRKLLSLLKELFQINQPDLDFGFYRIMHAKADEVSRFLDEDLLQIIADAFGETSSDKQADLKKAYLAEIQTARQYGAENPEEAPKVREAKTRWESAMDTATAEGEIYDHLYRFFERYYDNGDFLSKRYYARESGSKAAPYAVPYDGSEVYLHWANKDQYYIKTGEYFTNFTFDLNKAKEVEGQIDPLFAHQAMSPLRVHFRIVEATEGEHGNIKAANGQKRYFILHEADPVSLENGELIIRFEYRPDPRKSGQDAVWQRKLMDEAVENILARLDGMQGATEFDRLLRITVPTDKQKDRTLLAKYLARYTARNTMDYFIHKDLGGFLQRELDFYIKNEIMRLDDIENDEAPRVEQYLSKIRVLRKIARKIIAFLAQLEEFQKKLWLKKKFVTETNYCITLDRVPKELHPEIATNEAQHDEWVRLFAIDEIKGDLHSPAYSKPIPVDFLKAYQNLVVDTKFFDDEFKMRLTSSITDFDEKCDGVLIYSDNFHALNFFQDRYRNQVKCVYIDPPYNIGGDGFLYKDNFQHSSWLSLLNDRLILSKSLQSRDGFISVSIDDIELGNITKLLGFVYGSGNDIATLVWDRNRKNDAKLFSVGHEYMCVYSKDKQFLKEKKTTLREFKPGIDIAKKRFNVFYKKHKGDLEKIEIDWRNYIQTLKDPEIKSILSKYPKVSKRGPYRDDGNINWPGKGGPTYEVLHPLTSKSVKKPKSGWRYSKPERFWEEYELGKIAFGKDETTVPGIIYYLFESLDQVMGSVFWSYAQSTYEEFLAVTGERSFDNPKDTKDILRIVNYLSDDTSLILDFFAGSGTTGHAVINLNRDGQGKRKYILVEMGSYFETVLKPRIQKVVYSDNWKDGKPESHHTGISHCFKYLHLESYEDCLNNLEFNQDKTRAKALAKSKELREEYMLHYMLETETRGSQSLLNIDCFVDPTAYRLKVKKPGTDEYEVRDVDLIETFNYLIGLRVEHMDVPQSFTAEFYREPDPELPDDKHTRLKMANRKQTPNGPWWFRKIEGWAPGDNGKNEKILIVWRKLTEDQEKDNLMLDEWFKTIRVNPRDFEYDTIYVNGSNNLPNLRLEGENWKVRLIEEDFMKRMWDVEDV